MQFLRYLATSVLSPWKARLLNLKQVNNNRQFAHVHDVQIKWATGSGPHSPVAPPTAGGGKMSRNVFKQPLALHSTQPLTGFTRSGYCEAPKSDFGNHSIAAIVTEEFLDFSAKRGNDLRQVGLKEGCKWCLCVSRWKEAFDARTGADDKKVPKVVLKATNERALEGVNMDDLKKFAVDKE
ncbi:hypothetical protein ACN47E_006249 [Coniothyrium glycines]